MSPSPGSPGDRRQADLRFSAGAQRHAQRDFSGAAQNYQAAVQIDPTHFDAWFRLGLATYETGEWPRCLEACEHALALQPESIDARYNFAFGLKQANYSLDAAAQLERILQLNSSETRAHLALANLNAQQLHQPSVARGHYLKVLELNPRHPEAQRIRAWLGSNP